MKNKIASNKPGAAGHDNGHVINISLYYKVVVFSDPLQGLTVYDRHYVVGGKINLPHDVKISLSHDVKFCLTFATMLAHFVTTLLNGRTHSEPLTCR